MLTTVRNPDDVIGNLIYMNFTAVHPNGTMDAELASAHAAALRVQVMALTKRGAPQPSTLAHALAAAA